MILQGWPKECQSTIPSILLCDRRLHHYEYKTQSFNLWNQRAKP